ncbi:MAG TPA: LysR substrate-binding domain-containing protein [Rhizomicrobium sp.]|nr:LysR substrate-binding domain-containing protein [Rhizomicrobium sp.]
MKQNFTMRKGALEGVEAFLGVALHRNFRRAAAELGVTPSAISQSIRALEARLGATLFLRTTRSVGLTEAGERFLARAKPAFEELAAAGQTARDLGQRPSGLLRLTAPRAALPILVTPLIASFSRAYPQVEVELVAREELIDLVAEGFDAGVRLGQFIAADMVTVRLTKAFPLIVVASPGYLKQHGRPKHLEDLRGHACLRMRRTNGAVAPWTFVEGNKAVEAVVAGPLIANDFTTVLSGAIEGMGLAQVPEPIALAALKAGRLERVLDAFAPTAPGMFLYYPSRHQMMPKLRALVDHVKGWTAPGKTVSPPAQRRSGR